MITDNKFDFYNITEIADKKYKILDSKPYSGFVCDTIVKSILAKRHNGLESPTVFVLITDNKFDFYNITKIADKKYRILDRTLKHVIVQRVFTIHQLAHFFDNRFRKRYKKIQIKIGGYNR